MVLLKPGNIQGRITLDTPPILYTWERVTALLHRVHLEVMLSSHNVIRASDAYMTLWKIKAGESASTHIK